MYMGSCFSSSVSAVASEHLPAARVVAAYGSLQSFSVPISASEVLGTDSPAFFLCSSDALFYDAYIPMLKPEEPLVAGQLYFVLPAAMLDCPLTGLDMAALAVKASSALAASGKHRRHGGEIQFAPMVVDGVEMVNAASVSVGTQQLLRQKQVMVVSRMKKKKKMGRSGSLRRLASRWSFRQRLSTIDEVDDE